MMDRFIPLLTIYKCSGLLISLPILGVVSDLILPLYAHSCNENSILAGKGKWEGNGKKNGAKTLQSMCPFSKKQYSAGKVHITVASKPEEAGGV